MEKNIQNSEYPIAFLDTIKSLKNLEKKYKMDHILKWAGVPAVEIDGKKYNTEKDFVDMLKNTNDIDKLENMIKNVPDNRTWVIYTIQKRIDEIKNNNILQEKKEKLQEELLKIKSRHLLLKKFDQEWEWEEGELIKERVYNLIESKEVIFVGDALEYIIKFLEIEYNTGFGSQKIDFALRKYISDAKKQITENK